MKFSFVLLSTLLVSLSMSVGVSAQTQGSMDLHLYSADELKHNHARCLDGTPAGYYYRESTDFAHKDKWVFWLEGGALCQDPVSCIARSKTVLGSSSTWNKTRDEQVAHNILNTNATENPDFYSWNHVFIQYCSGDLHLGTRTTAPADNSTWGLYFAGHLIVKAAIDHLNRFHGMKYATEIIFTGDSAGGIGVFQQLDWFNEYQNEQSECPFDVRIVGFPQAGWFSVANSLAIWELNETNPLPYNYTDLWSRQVWATEVAAVVAPRACESWYRRHNQSEFWCSSIPLSFPFIRTPIFVAENNFDNYQIFTLGGLPLNPTPQYVPYVEYFGNQMHTSLNQTVIQPNLDQSDDSPQVGLFAPACRSHEFVASGFGAFEINGINLIEAFTNFYYARNSDQYLLLDLAVFPYANCTTLH